MVGVLFGRWSVVGFPFGWWSVVVGEFLVWSVVGGFYGGAGSGRLVMWSVVGVLHFYWSVVGFLFLRMVGGRCLNRYMVGGRWLMVGDLWSVAGRWAVVLYYAVQWADEYIRNDVCRLNSSTHLNS